MTPSEQGHTLAVGVDLVRVGDVAESIAHFGNRYLRRIYTSGEIGYCGSQAHLAGERFAARFAAKEAVIKVLRPTGSDAIGWLSIEVRRATEGWCDIVLRGAAEALAVKGGISGMALSMSHEREYATATVIAHRAIRATMDAELGAAVAASRRRTDGIGNQEIGESAVEDKIRSIVREHGRLSVDVADLTRDASLYQAGLTSHASVSLMLALEDQFAIEFPERLLRRRTFETIAGIAAAVTELTGGRVSAA